jgi:hypothetical protein
MPNMPDRTPVTKPAATVRPICTASDKTGEATLFP